MNGFDKTTGTKARENPDKARSALRKNINICN